MPRCRGDHPIRCLRPPHQGDATDGFWTTTSYERFGTVGRQHVRTNSQLRLSTWTYFDGWVGPIKIERTGPENKKTVTRTEYR